MDVLIADVIGDVALVLAVSWILGALARRIGQPTVVGQIIAGILLGPSLLGRLPGHLTSRLFTTEAIPYISVIAELAVMIFMFTVGYEIDFRFIRGHVRSAWLVGAGPLLVPMALGSGLAAASGSVFRHIGEPRPSGRSFVLFIGVAVSVTALPVLAAILRERGIAATAVGVVATTAAGIMDVSAWLVLAIALIGTKNASSRPYLVTLLLLAIFVILMLFVVRPTLKWWVQRPGSAASSHIPLALVLAATAAWATTSLGLHPFFGAFLAGLTMPGRDGAPDEDVLHSMEVAGGLLLPLFFVVTGLTTNIGALNGEAIAVLAVVVVIAMAGKIGPGFAAARLTGFDTRDSAMIGALVNTRGLTELIALNVGLSSGIIHTPLFTVLVLMALITTILTGPLISVIGRRGCGLRSERPPRPRETGRAAGGRREMHAQLSRERLAADGFRRPCPWPVRACGPRPWPSVENQRLHRPC
jgi:Kef-type K+ transport system membrane component KefB